MKVLVVGANGQIGQQLVQLLKGEEDYSPVAMVRSEEQAQKFADAGVETVLADLESSVHELVSAIKGHNAIVFTAGSGSGTGADKTLLIDLDGAVKVMEAAEIADIRRFVMVSALQAQNRENWNKAIRPYYVAKHYADKMLVASGLDYTIVRPGGLLNERGTGKIKLGENLQRGSIPREDVAKVILKVLGSENTIRRSFDLVTGEQQINEALETV